MPYPSKTWNGYTYYKQSYIINNVLVCVNWKTTIWLVLYYYNAI